MIKRINSNYSKRACAGAEVLSKQHKNPSNFLLNSRFSSVLILSKYSVICPLKKALCSSLKLAL